MTQNHRPCPLLADRAEPQVFGRSWLSTSCSKVYFNCFSNKNLFCQKATREPPRHLADKMQHKTRGLSKHLQRLFPDSWNGFDVGRRRLTEPVLCSLNSTAFSRHPTIFCIKGRCGWVRTKDESFTTLCEAKCCGVDARSCHLVHKCTPRIETVASEDEGRGVKH